MCWFVSHCLNFRGMGRAGRRPHLETKQCYKSQLEAGDTLLWHSLQISQGRSGEQDIVQNGHFSHPRQAIFHNYRKEQHFTGPNKSIPPPTATAGKNKLKMTIYDEALCKDGFASQLPSTICLHLNIFEVSATHHPLDVPGGCTRAPQCGFCHFS